jgi:TolB protein
MKIFGKVVFSSGKAGDLDIWSINLENGDITQLTTGKSSNDNPRWSPDGKKIAYVSNKSGVPQIWVMNQDGSNQTCITPEKKYHADPCWSPDNKHIIFAANYEDGDNVDIYGINSDGSGTVENIISYPGWDCGPNFSPDGKSIVFSSTRGGNEDIWEYTIKDKNWRQVTSHPARDFSPSYSPDGKWIGFTSKADETSPDDLSADSEIWIVSRDGMSERPLTMNSHADDYLTWSPDSQLIMCCSKSILRNTFRMRIIDIATSKPLDFSYDRDILEQEIGADTSSYSGSAIVSLMPSKLKRQFYPDSYFGSERSPHWSK